MIIGLILTKKVLQMCCTHTKRCSKVMHRCCNLLHILEFGQYLTKNVQQSAAMVQQIAATFYKSLFFVQQIAAYKK